MTSISIADRAELSDLVATYAQCLDRRDYAVLTGLFAPFARIGTSHDTDVSSERRIAWETDIAAWATALRENHRLYRITTHFIGQTRLARDEPEVKGETYCLAHHLYEEDGAWMNRILGIRYRDRFVRGEGWQFAERIIVIDWTEFVATNSRPIATGEWLYDPSA